MAKSIRINGKRLTNGMKETALENGISLELLKYRMRKKWDSNRAVTEPPRSQAKAVKSDKDMLSLAKKNGISGLNYRNRVRYGYTPLEAATLPIMDKDEIATLSADTREVIPRELIKQAAKNGIAYITLYRRLKVLKWTEEDAVTIPPLGQGEKLRKI